MQRPSGILTGLAVMVTLLAFCPALSQAAKKARPAPEKPVAREVSFDLGGGVSLDMVKVAGGAFKMGSPLSPRQTAKQYKGDPETYLDHGPVHQVSLKGFLMGKFEVTRAQFGAFVRATGHVTEAWDAGFMEGLDWSGDAWSPKEGLYWKMPGFLQSNSHPVTGISHNDAVAFCKWLSEKTGKKFRLPTEAEWECTARAGTSTEFFWGDEIAGGKGFGNFCDETAQAEAETQGTRFSVNFPFEDGYVFTSPVGKFKPNAWGFYDMLGNVEEWCSDWYEAYYYDVSPKADPKGPETGEARVVRGGNWYLAPALARSAYRSGYPPDKACDQVGFRVACDI